jgi:glycosyltransferase involved in cell wall biosynthesis
VIFNARNPELFRSEAKENFVFTAGRIWDEAKNVGALAEIAPDVPWPIYVAGENKEKISSHNIRLLGRLAEDDVAQWLGRAAIYAAPALYEPFGLSILEAALSGCALVLSDIPSLREVWNGAAEFVPAKDTQALKSVLLQLISNPKKRDDVAARAQCRAIQFNPEQMAAEYISAYGEIMRSDASETSPRKIYADTDVLSHAAV